MSQRVMALLAGLFLAAVSVAGPVTPANAAQTTKEDYQNAPFMVSVPAIPQVLLILSKNIQMFQQAYPGLVDMDGDGVVDTGFNPAVVYTGYFDPYSCYGYTSYNRAWSSAGGAVGSPTGAFVRVGASVPDESVATRPAGLKGYVKSPVSATGVCTGVTYANKGDSSDISPDYGDFNKDGTFSGNWLNYLTTSRMDAIRKILYGGSRVMPEGDADTYLAASFVPHDSTAWGAEVMADDLWSSVTPQSAYFDISKYTPFKKPQDGTAHFFSRTRDRAVPFQAFRMLPNAGIASFNCKPDGSSNGGTDSVGEAVEGIKGRYWDWALGNRPVPDDKVLREANRKMIRTYRVVVKVCEAGNISPTEGCMQYPNGNYKPVGLLQEYGQSGLMNFGLMTGSFSGGGRRQGGIVRNHIGNIARSIDPQSGKVITDGMISNMDRLMVSGRYIRPLEGWPYAAYYDTHSWGNPIGEMLYEGVRYFTSLTKAAPLSPTSAFVAEGDWDSSMSAGAGDRIQDNGARPPIVDLTRATSWDWNGRDALRDADCAKPVILLISDINSDYDGDKGVNDAASDLNQPLLSGLSGLPRQFSMTSYLTAITSAEGWSGKRFFFAKSSTDDCSAKTLGDLADVKGLCPGGPAFEGTYSAAAVAYYAHTHNFSPGANESPLDIYSVTMSSAYPELSFAVGDKKISIMPVNMTAGDNTGAVLSFLNYYILEWHADKDGTPFSVSIQVNFSDQPWGDDWEMDVIVTYKVDLLTTASLATAEERTASPLIASGNNMVSGVFRGNGNSYYGFRNPAAADAVVDFIKINPGKVVGLSVDSKIEKKGTSQDMGLGYTISGSTFDGTYLDLGLNSGFASNYQTPPTCPKAGDGSGNSTTKCRMAHTTRQQLRTFEFATGPTASFLPNPMFLAAKYGGFKETGVLKTGVPGAANSGRWDTRNPGVPDNYFQAANIAELPARLGAAFRAIAGDAATSTATASSINSVLGGGVSIQTLFYPEYKNPGDENVKIKWVGNIYGLFIDKWGNLREDSNGDQQLTPATGDVTDDITIGGKKVPAGDMVIEFVPQDNGLPKLVRKRDIRGDNTLIDAESDYELDSLEEVKALWNTSRILADMTNEEAAAGRSGYDSTAGRYIMSYFGDLPPAAPDVGWTKNPISLKNYQFTENNKAALAEFMLGNSALSLPAAFAGTGANKDTGAANAMYIRTAGRLPDGVSRVDVEIVDGSANSLSASLSGTTLTVTITRNPGTGKAALLRDLINAGNLYLGAPIIRASLYNGDDGDWIVNTASSQTVTMDREAATGKLINYIRGQDYPGWRSRTVLSPWEKTGGKLITWRMGDIINSKPVIVGAPVSRYDFIYRDTSYYKYKMAQGQRRQVAYFGSNDGMLHAVNLGFFGSLANGQAGYMAEKTIYDSVTGTYSVSPDHSAHKLGAELWAYVPTAVLPHLQWLADPDYDHSYYVDLKPQIVDIKNTGAPINADSAADYGGWETNEWRTVLIGGLRLGGRTIEMKAAEYDRSGAESSPAEYSYSEFFALDITDPEKPPVLLWRYSGPELGLSTCLPAVVSSGGNWYVVLGSGPTSDDPVTGAPINAAGSEAAGNAAYDGHSTRKARLIILDAITGRRMTTLIAEEDESFFNDSFTPIANVTRGRGGDAAQWDNHAVYFGLTKSPESATGLDQGAVYRLRMIDSSGAALPYTSWELKRLFKTDRPVDIQTVTSRPVSGAVNSARDSRRNLWVIFGTGRMWSLADASPCQAITDGAALKKCRENHTHYIYGLKEPMNNGVMTFEEITNTGDLYDVSDISVYDNGLIEYPGGGGTTVTASYSGLRSAIFSDSYAGYRRKLATWSIAGDTGESGGAQEACLYQPKITGLTNGQSLAAFTTYEPDINVCNPEGRSYLHVIDTFTGLPAPYMHQMGFIPGKVSGGEAADGSQGQQVTGYINAGAGKSTEAWIIGDIVGATGQDGTPHTLRIPREVMVNNAIISWREILDMGFTMKEGSMTLGIPAP